ncbi:hypothetical protein NQ317_001280 [Molorchus minor]|uniref:Uncharacterized protein n=1 Tax=Molorchus minor TaxID=1323400 RepID=A0ABQ9IT02_9CUCU|nr:hypothetical protein NQ317_001280 [Molorchus minor]
MVFYPLHWWDLLRFRLWAGTSPLHVGLLNGPIVHPHFFECLSQVCPPLWQRCIASWAESS